jgi:hypothetical protein
MGRNIFQKAGMPSSIGNEAFGFYWAAWLCLFIASALFCLGGSSSKHYGGGGGGGLFSSRSKRSARDRGSFHHDAETSR